MKKRPAPRYVKVRLRLSAPAGCVDDELFQ